MLKGRLAAVTGVAVVVAVTAVGCTGPDRRPAAASTTPTTRVPTTTVPMTTVPTTTVPTTTTPDPTTTAATPAPLAGKVVVVDPGHNGGNGRHSAEISRLVDIGTRRKACDTTGTATDAGYAESAYNWDVAVRLQELLRARGATVVLTRPDDEGWGPCIDGRATIGNVAAADAAVSIHADGGPGGGRGFHVILPASVPGLTDDIAAPSERLGLALRDAVATTGMPPADYVGRDGLDRRSDLGGLNLSDVPKVFVETGNMRSATDAALLSDPAWRQRLAGALADGIHRHLTAG